MLRSFQKLTQVDVGFKTENLLTLEYRLPANKYPEGAQQWEIHRQIVERVRAVPGVKSASVVRAVPFGGNGTSIPFEIPGAPQASKDDTPRALINFADSHYFETMGIPLLRGRGLSDQDGPATTPVVVIGRRMAERYWPNQDPVGRTILFSDTKNPITATVVGVVGDVKHYGPSDRDRMQVYAYQAQQPHIFNSLVVRTEGEPMAMTNAVRSAVWSVDPEQPMWKIYSMEFMVNRALGQPRFLMRLMTVYSALALLLAAVGLYGVMAYSVTQRATEIGVRMALGAQSRDVMRLILGRGFRLTSTGLVLGLAASLALGSSIRTLLYGVQATDPAALIGASVVLALVAFLASYLPARRATKANPVTVLHRT
jgi:putative ABC transport system permease protein